MCDSQEDGCGLRMWRIYCLFIGLRIVRINARLCNVLSAYDVKTKPGW